MATTRTAQLAAYSSTSSHVEQLVYTCPAGVRAIVKSAYFTSADPIERLIGLTAHLQGVIQVVIFRGTVQQWVHHAWDGWMVLEAGDTLTMYAQSPGAAVVVSGTELPVFV